MRFTSSLMLAAMLCVPGSLFTDTASATSGETPSTEEKPVGVVDAFVPKPWEAYSALAEERIPEWRTKAEQGDPEAQFNRGWAYYTGQGVPQNYKEAVKWYSLAADQGFAAAQCNLGFLYAEGQGVDQDQREAVKWYRLAAEQGRSDAQASLGSRYYTGQGVPQDYREAAKWNRLAAEQGDAQSQSNLGTAYEHGAGVQTDYNEAAKWYRLAADQGNACGQFNIGGLYEKGQGVPQSYRKAAKFYREAAGQGFDQAQNNLGCLYHVGRGVLEDYVEAFAWYSLAVMSGNEDASHNKENLKKNMNSNQLARGQSRAKELLAHIEGRTRFSDLKKDQVPASSVTPVGFGSGLMIQDGYILTCWHVVEDAKRITVNRQGKEVPVRIICKDENNDLAILHAEQSGTGYSVSFADRLRLGAQVFTMGFPHPDLQGTDVKYTAGTISSLSGPGNTPVYLQISVPVQAGNSGGPLFDEYGNLLGIVAAKLDSIAALMATGDLPQNVNYAIKADYLLPMLKTIDSFNSRPPRTKSNNHQDLVAEIKKSIVMITVY